MGLGSGGAVEPPVADERRHLQPGVRMSTKVSGAAPACDSQTRSESGMPTEVCQWMGEPRPQGGARRRENPAGSLARTSGHPPRSRPARLPARRPTCCPPSGSPVIWPAQRKKRPGRSRGGRTGMSGGGKDLGESGPLVDCVPFRWKCRVHLVARRRTRSSGGTHDSIAGECGEPMASRRLHHACRTTPW
jgi:hypothetical protein